MNLLLPERYDEHIERLALGIEPRDALRDRRLGLPRLRPRRLPGVMPPDDRLEVAIDQSPPSLRLPWIDRHDSCVFVVRYRKEISEPAPRPHLDIRLTDVRRRWAPRRIRYPILAEAVADSNPAAFRLRRPLLFPGAAYELPETVTGLRGHVRRAGRPLRWARIEAREPVSGIVVGRAHGDDRGEFLLALSPHAGPVGDLVDPLPLEVAVFGPDPAPGPPVPVALPQQDLLWDLPLEIAPAPGLADHVSDGTALPPTYRLSAGGGVPVNFRLGRLLTAAEGPPFVFT